MKTQYVVGFLFSEDAEPQTVALIEKKRPGWQAGKLNGIGGHVEPGEEPLAAMVREFKEETGADIPAEQWKYFCKMDGGDWVVWCYKSFGHPLLRSMTDEPVMKVRLTWLWGARENIIPNLNWLIPLALDPESSVAEVSTYLPGEGPRNLGTIYEANDGED